MSRRISQPRMMSDMRPSAAPSQTSNEPAKPNMMTMLNTMQTLSRLLMIRSTTRDGVAPAKADQSPMLVVPAGFGDSMAEKRVYPFDPTFFDVPANSR